MSRVDVDYSDGDRYLIAKGDLMFARRSLVAEGAGKCSIVCELREPTTWESSIIRARLDQSRAVPEYYFYYFSSPQGRRQMSTIVEQVAAAGIRSSELATLDVPHPSMYVQKGVSQILGALDDKITANSKLVTSIKMFLAAHVERIGLDDLGDPTQNITFDKLVELNPRVKFGEDKPLPYLAMKNLPHDSMTVTSWARREAGGGARFANFDTLLARITPCLENGKLGYVDFLEPNEIGVGSTEFIVLRPKSGVPRVLPYFIAASDRFRDYAIRHMVGTSGRQRLGAADVARYLLRRPSESSLAAFGGVADVVVPRVKSAIEESRALLATREELLPLLMSGRVQVKDAEKVVEEVL